MDAFRFLETIVHLNNSLYAESLHKEKMYSGISDVYCILH
jgi:hypothetical protein